MNKCSRWVNSECITQLPEQQENESRDISRPLDIVDFRSRVVERHINKEREVQGIIADVALYTAHEILDLRLVVADLDQVIHLVVSERALENPFLVNLEFSSAKQQCSEVDGLVIRRGATKRDPALAQSNHEVRHVVLISVLCPEADSL